MAEIFNKFFTQKIENQKDNIDTTQIKDTTEKSQEKVRSKNLNFTLKTVIKEWVKKVMRK